MAPKKRGGRGGGPATTQTPNTTEPVASLAGTAMTEAFEGGGVVESPVNATVPAVEKEGTEPVDAPFEERDVTAVPPHPEVLPMSPVDFAAEEEEEGGSPLDTSSRLFINRLAHSVEREVHRLRSQTVPWARDRLRSLLLGPLSSDASAGGPPPSFIRRHLPLLILLLLGFNYLTTSWATSRALQRARGTLESAVEHRVLSSLRPALLAINDTAVNAAALAAAALPFGSQSARSSEEAVAGSLPCGWAAWTVPRVLEAAREALGPEDLPPALALLSLQDRQFSARASPLYAPPPRTLGEVLVRRYLRPAPPLGPSDLSPLFAFPAPSTSHNASSGDGRDQAAVPLGACLPLSTTEPDGTWIELRLDGEKVRLVRAVVLMHPRASPVDLARRVHSLCFEARETVRRICIPLSPHAQVNVDSTYYAVPVPISVLLAAREGVTSGKSTEAVLRISFEGSPGQGMEDGRPLCLYRMAIVIASR